MTGAPAFAPASATHPSSLLGRLFARDVFAFERREPGVPELLRQEEAAASARFAPKRIAEFAAGRDCAHRALRSAGCADVDVPMRSDRSPQWPSGIVGSITHTNGFCGAVAALRSSYGGIGIDAEVIERVTIEMWSQIFTSPEIESLEVLGDAERGRAAAAMFSAKEAFYKCQSPMTGLWIDFHEVHADLRFTGEGAGDFTIEPQSAACRARFAGLVLHGKFCFEGGLVLTGMTFGPEVRA
ncbi:MAG: hypothetical protein NVS2B17_15050 [Candidatus Velthaea sp.]